MQQLICRPQGGASVDRCRNVLSRCIAPGEPKVLQPTSYLEYGTRLLRGRPQQPSPKAPNFTTPRLSYGVVVHPRVVRGPLGRGGALPAPWTLVDHMCTCTCDLSSRHLSRRPCREVVVPLRRQPGHQTQLSSARMLARTVQGLLLLDVEDRVNREGHLHLL